MSDGAIRVEGLDELQRDLRTLGDQTFKRVGKETLQEFWRRWREQVKTAWKNVRASGGTFRGEKWEGMKPQYTRKTDGVTVPAWGGVPKIRGKGNVKGHKRPSGRPVTEAAVMMQDTGNLRNAIIASPAALDHARLEVGPHGVGMSEQYASAQHERRPFCFWTPGDADDLERIYGRHIDAALAEFARGGQS